MLKSPVENILNFINENFVNHALELIDILKKIVEIYFEFAELFPKPFNILIIILIPSMFILITLKVKELIF
ncbi:MAG: hypothetical protein II309_01055 [Bacilli bacterium]|nr:hypothetical protein [Bacilli bacterium]